jgi:tetratricopeptide (TPR) repeat protein
VVGTQVEVESLPPVLVFLVRESKGYRARGAWGTFDALGVRGLQDVFFSEAAGAPAGQRVLYGFTAEPPHAADVVAISLPLQLALEAVFFHVAQIDELVLNPRKVALGTELAGSPVPQQDLEFSTPDDFDPMVRITREELPGLIGAVTLRSGREKAERNLLRRAASALQAGDYFGCFHLAHQVREANPGASEAWFYELFALSFFGSADRALGLYEQYPERGGATPLAQLLAARYRLLLKQFNEARTILHTLSFNTDLGALASSELARTFLVEKLYPRALDAANAALQKDPNLCEGYLLRGIALRGTSYEAGEVEGLRDAYADFERVAKRGGYAAAEALYHAGTVCARLGALPEAETAFRQSLFQRDRVSARDALIRVLCAQERRQEAAVELDALERLSPSYGSELRTHLARALEAGPSSPQEIGTEVRESAELWSEGVADSVAAARTLLRRWEVPCGGEPSDCIVLDDLINRFAPDGDFSGEGRFSALARAGHDTVARAMALYIGDMLVSRGAAQWGGDHKKQCTVVSSRLGVEIPIENFVKERILLGASGDNFSSLESLVVELEVMSPEQCSACSMEWWVPAGAERAQEIQHEVLWTTQVLAGLDVALSETLSDLEAIDLWIESAFEPGGTADSEALKIAHNQRDRFVAGLGLLVGQRIVSVAGGQWYDHEKPEGLSVWNPDLGRVFPVARLQRRVYLASAADYSSKLGSLAWSVAVAAVTGRVRSGTLQGDEDVRSALIAILPSIGSFPETELSGVVNSLLIGASLHSGGATAR